MKKFLLAVLMAVLLFSLAVYAETDSLIGAAAPDLNLPATGGKSVELQALRGKKLVLAFFTSWNRSGQAELAALNDLFQTDRARLAVVAVSFDKKTKELKDYLAAAGLLFPVLQDKKLTSIDSYRITVIPTTFCINQDGVIEKAFVDYDDNVQKALEDWLKP